MPSQAYSNFQINLRDVDRLVDTHTSISGSSRGKKGLGHLTRSGIVMLSAAFEVFIEELTIECIELYINRFPSIRDFPKQCKHRMADLIKSHQNELEMFNLSGDGWKDMLRNHVRTDCQTLNTPKYNNIDVLINRYLGIKEFSKSWMHSRVELNELVSIRGEIAHNGSKAKYVKIKFLKESRVFIRNLCQEIDEKVCDHITSITPGSSQPWRKRYT
ncbi:HEPN domain-containing protein [Algoriphagus formosus]|uniref:HEPN domain-containing protein n=1 Tax=Algoriphagus formosus TaxID=2007308 RepID=UPI003F723878